MKELIKILALIACVFTQIALFAQEAEQEKSDQDDLGIDKVTLSERDLAKKKEGYYFTGLPLVNFDPVTGVGYGARAYFYHNGSRSNPLFKYTPYLHKLYAQFFQTTGGWSFHTINWDAPYFYKFLGKWFRVRSEINYDRLTGSNYYGFGDDSLDLRFRQEGEEIFAREKIVEYQKSLDSYRRNEGFTAARYNKWDFLRPTFIASTESDVFYFGGGVIRPILGLTIQWVQVKDYTGEKFKVSVGDNDDDKEFTQVETKLKQDCNAGIITGCEGSWNNSVKIGVAFDSRDFEPDPNRGIFADAVAEFTPTFLGSRFGYSRYTIAARFYYDPIPNYENLVLAAKGFVAFYVGDNIPFYALMDVIYSDTFQPAHGGLRTLRGFLSRRFVGKAVSIYNFEIRWTFWDVSFWKQHFAFMLVPFLDVGRVFNDAPTINAKDWKLSYGAGFRIAWNQSTIIIVDYALSTEGGNLYIQFNHIF